VLKQWLRVTRWAAVLRTDQLIERIIAAQLKSGFLSLFSLGWSVIMSIVEAFQSSFVVADSNRYYATVRIPVRLGVRALLGGAYRRSTIAAVWLTACAIALTAGAAIPLLARAWDQGVVSGLPRGEALVLLPTLVIALLILFSLKQLVGAYTIQERSVELVRGLTLVYVAFIALRFVLTWQWGAVGFCVGLIAYYGSQVAILARRV